jgi:5-methylcytosine-specific restriction protein A
MARTAKAKIRSESASARRLRLNVKEGHCTWCRKKIPKSKTKSRLWCGDKCVEAFKEANWPQHRRKSLEARDKGICAGCGVDTKEFAKLVKSLRQLAWDYGLCLMASWLGRPIASLANGKRPWRPWKYKACQCVFCVAVREAQELAQWEADHILPVVEGGGLCGLDGYRTLCKLCHKKETAALAARRAERRRAKKSPNQATSRRMSLKGSSSTK